MHERPRLLKVAQGTWVRFCLSQQSLKAPPSANKSSNKRYVPATRPHSPVIQVSDEGSASALAWILVLMMLLCSVQSDTPPHEDCTALAVEGCAGTQVESDVSGGYELFTGNCPGATPGNLSTRNTVFF